MTTPRDPGAVSRGEPFCALTAAFRNGSDSPLAYLQRCWDRIDAHEAQIRAFVVLDREGALAMARASTERYRSGSPLSPVDGMPVGIKDIIRTHDLPTQMGSPIYAGFQPRRDAACVSALRSAGAVIVGKTVTTEFAAGRAGPTRNPSDVQRTPGGSSSGSAAAVAAGMLPAALGTQTMASVVRPASYCGVFGWKPSHGLFPTDGVQPLSATLDHLGVLARDPRDAWEVARVLAAALPGGALDGAMPAPVAAPASQPAHNAHNAPAPRKPRRLMQLRTQGWDEAGEPSRRALAAALERLAAAGVEVLPFDDPAVREIDALVIEAAQRAWSVFGWESQWPLRSYRDRGQELIGPRLHELLQVAATMTRADHAHLLAWRGALRERVTALAGVDCAFVSIASSGPAPLGLDNTGSRACGAAWSLVGGPAFSLPVLQAEGMPLGLQLMAAPDADIDAFAMARWVLACLSAP